MNKFLAIYGDINHLESVKIIEMDFSRWNIVDVFREAQDLVEERGTLKHLFSVDEDLADKVKLLNISHIVSDTIPRWSNDK